MEQNDPLKDGYLYNGETKQQPKSDSTAAKVVNFPRKVPAFGKEYEVRELTLGQLIRAAEHIAPLGYLLRSAGNGDITDLLVNALAIGGPPAMGLLSVVTEEPVEWLGEQNPIEGAELLTDIIEVNVDYFFDSANLERLKKLGARLTKVVERHAPKPNSGEFSTSSSVADMAH